jgi:AcrR family transcriptional regulator
MSQNRMVSPNPSTPVRPGLRERKKARTKATIQREALRLFSEQGYAETSVEQIADAAEISPSTFFRYFPTKEEVVLTDFIDARMVEKFRTAPAELGPPAALRHAIEELMADVDTETWQLETVRNELIRQVPELRRGMLAELFRPISLIADALADRLGLPEDDEDVRTYAGALIGGLIGPAVDHGLETGQTPSALREDILKRLDRLEPMLRLPKK